MSTESNERFSIDPEVVVAARAQLLKMAQGLPIAEAAVEGFNDWQVIEAMERLWEAGTTEPEPPGKESEAQARRGTATAAN